MNEATLASLVADLGAGDVARVWATFAREAREGARAIVDALDAGDTDAAARAAHRLKSAGVFLGATRLARLCAEIDALARADRLADARSRAECLPAQVEQATERIGPLVGDVARPAWPECHDRPAWPERHDRPAWPERHDRPAWPERHDRPAWPER
ncbi:MAG: Hpt domain-containing protein, partial [Acidimicrobiales bacterium]